MKKIMAIALSAVLALSLVACGGGSSSNANAKNGTYTAQVDDAYAAEAGHGWRDEVTVVYKDGEIESASFDSVNTDSGVRKSDLTDEEYGNFPITTVIPELNAQLTAGKVDGVSGATSASNSAKALLEAIEKEGKAGETITVQMEIPADED